MTTDELHELASLYSIQLTYEDAGGKKRTASRESLEAVLRVRAGDDLKDALRRRREEIARQTQPVKVVWGEKDLYINKEMGIEFAERLNAELTVLPGIGHFPHLQNPTLAIDE